MDVKEIYTGNLSKRQKLVYKIVLTPEIKNCLAVSDEATNLPDFMFH